MAKSYYLIKTVFENKKVYKTKRVGKRYVHFTLPNGMPLKVNHTTYKHWNGGVL